MPCWTALGRRPSWMHWSGPTCSSSRWTSTAGGTGTTGSSGTSCTESLHATAPADIPGLLRRAADWYRSAGQTEEAVRLLIAAGDRLPAAQLLLAAEDVFLEQGMAATFLRLGDQLGEATIRSDPRLAVTLAGAAGQSGQPDRVPALLDIAEPHLADDRPIAGWRSLAAAAAVLRAAYDPVVRADPPAALAYAERAARLETDPTLQGYVVARITLGAVLSGLDRHPDAVPVLTDAWERSARIDMPMFIRLQAAGLLAMCLFETGEVDAARRLVRQTAPAVQATVDALGDASAVAVTFLITIDGRLAYRDGRPETARRLLARAAELARIAGHPSQQVHVLTALADAALATGDRAAARAALEEARETAETGVAFPATARRLAAAEERLGKRAGRAARRNGQLAEELTDRELSLLRALQGPLSQREIGHELYLSINTIKGYTKSLYRKLGAASRTEAVERGRQLGLIYGSPPRQDHPGWFWRRGGAPPHGAGSRCSIESSEPPDADRTARSLHRGTGLPTGDPGPASACRPGSTARAVRRGASPVRWRPDAPIRAQPDQAALRSVLSLLWDVGLEVLVVEATPLSGQNGKEIRS